MSSNSSSRSIIEQLFDVLLRPVTAESRAKARLHLLDWIGCAVIGSKEPAGKILLSSIDKLNNGEVFALGGLGNILEMDDIEKQALLHPGPCIVPASLQCANERNVNIETLLDAIVRGYEATIRLGRALGVQHYAIWHSTGTCGLIGAATACATILKLDREEFSHGLALAVSQTAGLWQTRHEPKSMGKQLHTAHAARAGYESAFLASSGFRGPLSVIEGEQGLFVATAPDSDPHEVVKDYESDWLIHETSFKPWPACRHAHPAIDATLIIQASGTEKNVPVRVKTYSDALKFCNNPNPQTTIEAKFSLQHSVAICLLKGKPKLSDFEVSAIQDSEIKQLREVIHVEASEQYDSKYPAHFGAEVRVGDKVAKVSDALGDPENPMSKEQIIEKARNLMEVSGVEESLNDSICSIVTGSNSKVSDLYRQLWNALG